MPESTEANHALWNAGRNPEPLNLWTGQAVLIDASSDRHFNRGEAW
jgi:hypothetical protein